MTNADQTFTISAAFAAVFALAYASSVWFQIPLPVYYPVDHAWRMTRQQGVPTVSWYGHVGFALAAGGLVALTLGRILSARPRGPLTPGRLRALSVIAILIITGCMVSLIFHEWRWFR